MGVLFCWWYKVVGGSYVDKCGNGFFVFVVVEDDFVVIWSDLNGGKLLFLWLSGVVC